MAKKKKTLTRQEEFEILKLVLDKFLWAGIIILLFGFWHVLEGSMRYGFWIMVAGAFLLTLFTGLLIKEYEILK